MAVVLMILLGAGYFVAGFVIALVAQFLLVPLFVLLLGRRHFVSPTAFDGCTLGLIGGFIAVVSPGLLWAKRSPFQSYSSPLWVFAFIGLGMTLYGLLYLWALGFGGRKREWRIIEGQIIGRNQQVLHPTFVFDRNNYIQTDAYHGYSHYLLELHGRTGLLATNAYTVEKEFARDLERVRSIANAKRLDLVWFCQVGETKWMAAYFPDEWAPILCGSLERLDGDDREWWQMWVYPNFESHHGREVDAQDARGRLRRLNGLYGDELGDEKTEVVERLHRLLASEHPVIAMSSTRFYKHIEEVRGNRDLALFRDGDFIELVPLE